MIFSNICRAWARSEPCCAIAGAVIAANARPIAKLMERVMLFPQLLGKI
jgi:hypothetical protein